MSAEDRFLPTLTQALLDVAKDDPPNTAAFTQAMDKVLPVFDHMGTILFFSCTPSPRIGTCVFMRAYVLQGVFCRSLRRT